jgi:Domain of unknown function (DUF4386)
MWSSAPRSAHDPHHERPACRLHVSLLHRDRHHQHGPVTLFCYLFLRARSVPVPLAQRGVVASLLLVVALILRVLGFLHGPVTYYVWIPMALFGVALALWLLVKGVAAPREKRA